MKKLLFTIFLLSGLGWAQTQTTVTGVVQSPSGGLATSGYVQFTIQPASSGVLYTIPGTTILAPQSAKCGIDGTGNLKNLALSGACLVWGNDLISPTNTLYSVVFAPSNTITNTVFNVSVTGANYNLNSPKFGVVVSLVPQFNSITTNPLSTNIIPAADNAFVIGSPNFRFSNVYTYNLNIAGTCVGCSGVNTFNGRTGTVVPLTGDYNFNQLSGVLGLSQGGSGQSSALLSFNAFSPLTTRGDILTHDPTNNVRLAIGANGTCLISNGTDPSWGSCSGGVSGTVTSFSAHDLTPLFTQSVTNPTTTPDLTFTLSNAGAHQFFGNNTGGSATPAYFQPAFTDLSGTATIGQGGTGQVTQAPAFDALAPTTTRGDLSVRGASSNVRLAIGSNGQCLTSNGTDEVWGACGAGGWTFSSGNKRWELFDSTIATWLVEAIPGFLFDANMGTCQSSVTANCAGVQWAGTFANNSVPQDGYQIGTNTTSNNIAGVAPGRMTSTPFIQAGNVQSFWVEADAIQSDANTTQRLGLFSGTSPTADPPADGIFLERLGADTNWFLVTQASSTQTRCDTTIAHSAAVFNFVVVKNGTTDVKVYVPGNATAKCTNTTNIPANATGLTPVWQVKTLTTAQKNLKTMYFRMTGLQQSY